MPKDDAKAIKYSIRKVVVVNVREAGHLAVVMITSVGTNRDANVDVKFQNQLVDVQAIKFSTKTSVVASVKIVHQDRTEHVLAVKSGIHIYVNVGAKIQLQP